MGNGSVKVSSPPSLVARAETISVDDEPKAMEAVDLAADIDLQENVLGLSLSQAFELRMRAYADRPCLGWRQADSFCWMSYSRFFCRSRQIGLALSSKVSHGSTVGICGENSVTWFMADFACLWAGLGVVPLSEDWDAVTLGLVLEKCEVDTVFCDARYLPRFRLTGRPLCLISLRETSDTGDANYSLDQLIACDLPEIPIVVRPPDGIHTILHTSGTTGLPKGVVYTDNLWLTNMVRYPGLNVGYSYMPLAYITDRHTVCTNFWNGGRVGVRTPGPIDEMFRDLQIVRPTVLKGVPALFENVKNAVNLVHDKSLALLGGRCQVLICGAGALDESTANVFRGCEVLGKKVSFLEMYGGTECGNIAINRQLLPHVEYKLLPYADMPCDSGELVVKTGGAMFSGYHKDPERTRKAFTDDGFYMIGDLVHIKDGRVDVIGRAKTSIKLGNGKWVFPESLEGMYRSALHANGVRYVWLYGDSQHDALVAVIDGDAFAEVGDLLLRMHKIAVEAGKLKHEHVSGVILATEQFSLENKLLNGTGKLDRRQLIAAYKDQIDAEFHRLAAEAAKSSLDALQSEKSFASQGGSSLHASRIASLYLELGIPISRVAKLLLSDQPVKEVMEELMAANPAADAAQLDLPQPVTPALAGLSGGWVLLTGATGFVGRFVLAELLSRGHSVVSLVRARDELDGKKRLRTVLVEAGRWSDSWWSRLEISVGSLLTSSSFDVGAHKISVIIHSAAVVNLRGTYEFHRAANVLGTVNILEFAARAGARVIFVSTTDTYKTLDEATVCSVEPPLATLRDTKHGYAVSKAVGESLVAEAARQGVSACTVRLGMISGDTLSGFCMPTDFALRLIIGFSHTGAFPSTDDRHTMVHSVPVDVAAEALVDIAEGSLTGAANIVSGAPLLKMAELREQLLRFGHGAFQELPVIPFAEWMKRVESEAQLSAWPIIAWASGSEEFPVFNTRCPPLVAPWARAKTLMGLNRGVDEACMFKMLRYTFVEHKRLEKTSVSAISRSVVAMTKWLHRVRHT